MERYLGGDFEFKNYNNSSIYLDIYDEHIESLQIETETETENILDMLEPDVKCKVNDVKGLLHRPKRKMRIIYNIL